MNSSNTNNFRRKHAPRPPITEFGASPDSGSGPSKDSAHSNSSESLNQYEPTELSYTDLRPTFPPSSALSVRNLPTPAASIWAPSEEFRCPLCKSKYMNYMDFSSFAQHLKDKHRVCALEYVCDELRCTARVFRQDEMKEHMRNVHNHTPSPYQMVGQRIQQQCPALCKICSQPTGGDWTNFYQHAKDHYLEQTDTPSNSLDKDEGKSTPPPKGKLGQNRRWDDGNRHALGKSLPPADEMRAVPPVEAIEVVACVATIVSAYSDGVELFTAIRKKYREREFTQELEISLALSGDIIQSRYNQFYQELGRRYEEGDSIARGQMEDIIIRLQEGLLRYLSKALEKGTTLDLMQWRMDSEWCRDRTIDALENLSRRLPRLLVPLFFSMSFAPTEENLSEMELEKSLPPRRMKSQDPIVHQQTQLSLPQSSDSSDTLSIESNVTSPESEDDSIDAGIPEIKNMDHILDAARYFGELDRLELQTAQILGISNGPYIKLQSLDDGIEYLGNWEAALACLQSEGFCGTTMSILIEDQDRHGIASAVHLSLKQIGVLIQSIRHRFDEEESLKRSASDWMQKMLNVEDKALSDLDSVGILRFLFTILSIGIVSFSGSHVCRFDINLWNQEMEEIQVGFDEYAFKPRKLACLDEFIGGPAWILGKACTPSEGMKVSVTVQDVENLWGPISLVGGTVNEAPVIQTERGFIVPLPRERQSSLFTSSLRDEIECHWVSEIPEYLFNQSSEMKILIRNTSRILIGTATDVEGELIVNEKCKSSISVIGQQIAYRFQYPGTSKSRYVSDGYDVQLVGGQYVTAGLMKKYKRIPKRTLKAMLIADCTRPDTLLMPLLNLRVGLEVSACTGNAQRVTLWDALRFSQASTHSTDQSTYCAHKFMLDEIDSVDHMSGQHKPLTSGVEARRVIINSILALEHSGVDSEGNLQVSWPFSKSPVNCHVLPSTPTESHNWFRIVKDTQDTSSFAVFSQRCLEFPEKGVMRSCSAPCKEEHSKPLQTTLSTRILAPARAGSVSRLLVGVKFLVGEAHLTVTKAAQDQLIIIAAVSMNPLTPLRHRLREILPDARAFDFKEHIRPDLLAGRSVPVFVY
ncbi:hypothetical protein N7449_010864 [Penicillium cf. viridicatum]|uniref:C2H2-type domain-containing protein n=1 Tax=Penicillium cf. viridicatum TaxID=2972119 RepID=A0A9W9M3J5_9EURO|nr:hypothetical protein N7449_010864 [Penicillium cf. viridicatum]